MFLHNKNDQKSILYGLDIGGTKIEIGIFDQQYNQLDSWRVSTPTQNYHTFLSVIHDLILDADSRCNTKGIIGIGMPGIIDKHEKIVSANVPCATGKLFKQDLQAIINRDVAIANDCRLFALSEAYGGAGDKQDVIYGAIIGTGAGGGLCIHGKLLETINNTAGEYGHISAPAKLIAKYNLPIYPCGCGLTGCIESYIAGPGLSRLYEHFGAKNNSTAEFVKQLRANDKIAQQVFNCYMDLLGSAFASLVLSYDPNVIVVGGGLSKIDEIIHALPNAINQHLFSGIQAPVIKRAKFGDSSGVRGAAILGSQYANH